MRTTEGIGGPKWLSLASDESVWLYATPSNNVLLLGIGVDFLLLVVGSSLVGFVGDLETGRLVSLAMLAVILALLAGTFLFTRSREYVVTSERVCRRAGITDESVTALPLAAVDDVSIEQSRWQGWLGVGHLRFGAADHPDLRFTFVERPESIFEQAAGFVDAAQARRNR